VNSVDENSRPDLERAIQDALGAGQLERAATLVLRGYGPEILGFLLHRLEDDTRASEAFAMFAEDLWLALPGLVLSATMRAYAYALARNAAHRLLGRQVRKERLGVPLSDARVCSKVANEVRASTLPHLKTTIKAQVAELRGKLSEEEQTLLTLRVDRELSWPEIAIVYADGAALDQETLLREAARLRKRFEATKLKLRRLAEAAGMLARTERDDG
jgi:RNA polymerase sigma-70 factor (ECF subfamily)